MQDIVKLSKGEHLDKKQFPPFIPDKRGDVLTYTVRSPHNYMQRYYLISRSRGW